MRSLSNDYRLGIDIGRVIITPGDAHHDTSFISGDRETALRTPPMEGAFECIKLLVNHFSSVWLVSKCGHRIQERTKSWLMQHSFWTRTGMNMNNIRFCRKRHEKAPIAQELGITHFIDDRADCLDPMRGIVEHRFLFGPQKREPIDTVARVMTWADVQLKVLATLGVPNHG